MKRTFAITSICLAVLLLGATFAVQAGTVPAQSGVLHMASHAMSSARHAVSAMFQETGHVQSNRLTSSAHMVSPRSNACSVALKDHRVLITGGTSADGSLSSAEILSTNSQFSSAPPMMEARSEHGCALLPDGRVLVAGGRTNGGATNSSEIFDPETNSWSAGPQMMWARAGATFSVLRDGRVLIAGGESSGNPTNTLEVYDPSIGAFSAVRGHLSTPRTQHAAAVLKDGRVLIVGGSDGSQSLAASEIFNPETGEVVPAANMNIARAGLTATSMLNGQVLILGGSDGKTESATGEIFNARTGRFTVVPGSMATARRDHVAIRILDNNAILIAGGTSAGDSVSSTELYVPWQRRFTPMAAMDVTRTHASGIAVRSGNVMIAGGVNHHDTTGSTNSLTAPTILTNKSDYKPGEPVIFSGQNWTPGAKVTITMTESDNPNQDTPNPITVTVASDGTIYDQGTFSPDTNDFAVTFYVTATEYSGGQPDGLTAQTEFTDGNIKVIVANCTGSASACTGSTYVATDALTTSTATQLHVYAYTADPVPDCNGDSTTTNVDTSKNTPTGYSLIPAGLNGANVGAGNDVSYFLTAPAKDDQGKSFQLWGTSTANQGTGVVTVTALTSAVGTSYCFTSHSSSTATYTAVYGGTIKLAFKTIPSTVSTSACTAFVVEGQDDAGNPIPPAVAINATLANGSDSNAGFYSDSSCTTPATTASLTTSSADSSTLYFKYKSTGTTTITATGPAYTSIQPASQSVTASNQVSQTITLSGVPSSAGYNSTFNASASSTSGLTVVLSLDASSTACSLGSQSTTSGTTSATVTMTSGTGNCVIDANQSGNGSFLAASQAQATAAASAASQTITLSGVPSSATYNGTFTASASSTSGLTVALTLDASSTACSLGTPTTTSGTTSAVVTMTSGTGSCVIDANQSGNSNYSAAAQKSATASAQKATATVTLSNMEQTYTGSALTPTATTTPANLTINWTGAPDTGAGTYPVTATINDSNYQGSASGTFTIDKANATISVTPYSTTYDGFSHVATGSAKGIGGGTLSGLDLSGTTHTNAGTFTDTWTFTDSTGNYNNTSGQVSDSIGKATATISVTGYSVTYNGSAHTATGSATGVGSAPLSGLDLSGTTHTNAGNYTDTWTFTDSTGNYSNATGQVTDAIAKANQSISVGTLPTSQTYNTTFTANATGGGSTSPVMVTASGGCSGSGNIPQTITMTSGTTACSLAFNQAGDTNYNAATQQTASVTAVKATASVSLSNMEQTYTGSALTPAASTTPANLTINWTGAPDTNAGSYSVTATINDNNYQGSATGTFVIDKAAATVTLSNMEQTYTGNALTPTATTAPANLTINWTGAPDTNAGSYPVTATINDTNYQGSASGTFTIDKANATITVTPYNLTYDGSAHQATGTATGVTAAPIAGLSIRTNTALSGGSLGGLNLSGTNHTNAGTYTDTWTFTDSTGNYNNAAGQVTDTIAKANQTISLGTLPTSQIYNTTFTASATGTGPSVPTVTASGGCSGSGAVPATITMTSGTAACSLAFDSAGNDNYNPATEKTASVTAVKATATVSLTNLEQTYTGSALTPTASTTPANLTITWTGAPDTNANVSGYPVTATINDSNYQGSASGTFIIDKAQQAPLSVTGPASVTYGQTGTATSSGGSGTGAVTFSASGSTGCSVSGTTVSVTSATGTCLLTATKAGDSNYLPGSASASFPVSLNKAYITVTAANQSMTFGGTVPSVSASISGAGSATAAADSITASASTAVTSSTDVGGYAIVPHLGDPNSKLFNYNVTSNAGTLTVNPYADPATAGVNSPATYEGNVTMTGQLAVPGLANGAVAATSATFSICAPDGVTNCQVMGSASVSSTGSASLTAPLIETVPGAMDPTKSHVVVAQFTGGSPNGTGTDFSIPPATAALVINPVQATPVYGSFYTGASVFWTPTLTSNAATMFLSASIQDSSCTSLPSPSYGICGDITKARVSFGIRNSDNSITPIAGAQNLPVGYVDQTNHAVGSAAATVQYNLQSNAASAQLDIAVTVTGYYVGNNPKWDYVVTVARPVPGGSLLFAGTNVCNSGTGTSVDRQQDMPCSAAAGSYTYPEAGVLVGDSSTLSAIQGNVTWNKSQTNPQGQILAVVSSPYNAQGVKDGLSHTYQIKSNAISTFVVKNTWAQFTGKASIVDVATGTAVDGGALINITVCNGGSSCPTNSAKTNSTTFTAGRDGAISLQVNNSKTGGAWFVIGWNGANSVPQNAVTGSITVNP